MKRRPAQQPKLSDAAEERLYADAKSLRLARKAASEGEKTERRVGFGSSSPPRMPRHGSPQQRHRSPSPSPQPVQGVARRRGAETPQTPATESVAAVSVRPRRSSQAKGRKRSAKKKRRPKKAPESEPEPEPAVTTPAGSELLEIIADARDAIEGRRSIGSPVVAEGDKDKDQEEEQRLQDFRRSEEATQPEPDAPVEPEPEPEPEPEAEPEELTARALGDKDKEERQAQAVRKAILGDKAKEAENAPAPAEEEEVVLPQVDSAELEAKMVRPTPTSACRLSEHKVSMSRRAGGLSEPGRRPSRAGLDGGVGEALHAG
eukprot:COSAG04_NODE_2851_length_3486_cov_204.334219_3_plen_318_part_00